MGTELLLLEVAPVPMSLTVVPAGVHSSWASEALGGRVPLIREEKLSAPVMSRGMSWVRLTPILAAPAILSPLLLTWMR